MKNFISTLFVASCLIISSCEVKVNTGDDKNKHSAESNSKNKIRNNIQLDAKGLKVEQAFLLLDDGTLVGDDNKVKVNDR